MKKLILFSVLLCVVGVAFMAGCTQEEPSSTTPTPTETTAVETPAETTAPGNETAAGNETADTLVNEMIKAGSYVTFLDFVYLTGVNEEFFGQGSYTVFAPVDEIVPEYISRDKENDIRADPEFIMKPIVLGHIVEGTYTSEDFATPTNLTTLAGTPIVVAITDGNMTVNGVAVVNPDLEASNGVVHGIEGVILPSNFAA